MKKVNFFKVVLVYSTCIVINLILRYGFINFSIFNISYSQNSLLNEIVNQDNIINLLYIIVINILLCNVFLGHHYTGNIKIFRIHSICGYMVNILFLFLCFQQNQFYEYIFSWESISINFFYLLIPAIYEELLFRSFILDNLLPNKDTQNMCKVMSGILISSILFSLLHLQNLLSYDWKYITLNLGLLTLLGILIAIYQYYQRNLSVCISIHMTYNMIIIFFPDKIGNICLGIYLICLVGVDSFIIIKNYLYGGRDEKFQKI